MSDLRFQPYMQSPLHAFDLPSRAVAQDDRHGVWTNELPLRGYLTLRGQGSDAAFRDAVANVLGQPLPTQPSSYSHGPSGTLLWISPDEWLLSGERSTVKSLIPALESALKGQHVQVVDNSGGYTQVYLTGRHAVTLLRHLGVYDFEQVTVGRAVSTMLTKANVTVYRLEEGGLHLVFRRSFADYVWRLIERAAIPYGLGICSLPAGFGLAG